MNILKKQKIMMISIIGVVLLVIIFVFCYSIFFRSTAEVNSSGKIKIGLSIDSLVVERWTYDRDIFLTKAKQLGADVIFQNASNDSDEQINQIKFLISQKVDVLVIVPNDSEALSAVVDMARKKGIAVISYDRLIKNANVDLYVCFDNENVGKLMGKAIVKRVPKGKYVIINGNKRDNNAILFNRGYKNVLKPYIQNGDIKIMKEVWAKGWKEKDAYDSVENVLSSGQNIDAIIAGNDRLAEAAIQVLAEHRLAGKVAVVGGDASLPGCQSVVEGLQLMTVYKPIKTLAQSAAEAAVKMAKHQPVNTTLKINDGTYDIPIILEQVIAVDKDNIVDVIVKNNFHTIEDIYRNIPKSKWPKLK